MNSGDYSSTGDGGFDEDVQLFVSSDSQLQVSWGNSSDVQFLGGVSGQLEDLSSQVLEDGGSVDCGGGADSVV